MSEPKKYYKFVFIYNPAKNEVRRLRIFNGEEEGVEHCIRGFSLTLNVQQEIILGKSIIGNYYQLYFEKYSGGSYYVREDAASVKKFMNPSKIGVALSKYITEHKLWKYIKD